MTKTYLLIDLQNRPPEPADVASWMGSNGEAWIFFGGQEVKMLAQYMELGSQISLVDISRPGKNSLDFHLVLYLGYLVGRHEPDARFVIVADDGDYDPAIAHARSKGKDVERVDILKMLPDDAERVRSTNVALKQSTSTSMAGAQAAAKSASANRKKPKSVDLIFSEALKDVYDAGRPKTLEALQRRIQWRFGPEPVPDNVADVISRLAASDAIRIVDGNLDYVLPTAS